MVDRLIKESKPVKNVVLAKLLLMEAYDVTYGVFDHITQYNKDKNSKDPEIKRPLSVIAMHETEEVSEVSLLYERINSYSEKKVKDYFGISLKELLDLPRDIVDHIFDQCDKRLINESRMQNNILDQLNLDKK